MLTRSNQRLLRKCSVLQLLCNARVWLSYRGTVAHKIMQKYGFREGQGLGKHEQGLSTALSVEKTSKRGGKIIVGDSAEKSEITHTDTQNHMQAHTSHSFQINILRFFSLVIYFLLSPCPSIICMTWFIHVYVCFSVRIKSECGWSTRIRSIRFGFVFVFHFSITTFGCFVCFIMIIITYINTLMFSLQEPRTHVTVADFSKRADKSHLINNDWWIIDNDE